MAADGMLPRSLFQRGPSMTRTRIALAAGAVTLAALLAAPAAGLTPRLAQTAALIGEWSATEPCATSTSRLRFRGDTLAVFSGSQRMSEYEVTLAEAGDRVTVRVVRVVQAGALPPGGALQYRREGDDALRLVGIAMRGDAFAGPTVATLYRRCK